MSPSSSTTASATLVKAIRAAEFIGLGSDPTRASIVMVLREGERSGGDLVGATGAKATALAPHLRKLRIGGLIESSRGQQGARYRLTDRGRKLAGAIDSLTAGEASR